MEKTIQKLNESRISNAELIKYNLICMNCNNLVTDFIMVCMRCNYRLCQGCNIEFAFKNKLLGCTECKASDPYMPKKVTEEELKHVFVRCKYFENGCTITPSFLDYIKHEEECNYRPIECKECRNMILFKDRDNHLTNDCEEIFINCERCKTRMQRKYLEGHLKRGECFIILSSCLNCQKSILIKDLKLHKAICLMQISRCQTCNIVKQRHDCLLELTKNTLSKINYIKNSINDQRQDHEIDREVQIDSTRTIEKHLTENVREGNESLMQLKKDLKEDHSIIINEESNLVNGLHNMQMEIINQRDITMNLLENNRIAILKQGTDLEQKIDNGAIVFLKECHEIQESYIKSNEELINHRNEINAKINQVDLKLDSQSEIIFKIDNKLNKLIEAFDEFKNNQINVSKIQKENINDLIRNSQVYNDGCALIQKEKESLIDKLKKAENCNNEMEKGNQKLRDQVKEKEATNEGLNGENHQLQEALKGKEKQIEKQNDRIMNLEEDAKVLKKEKQDKLKIEQQLKEKNEANIHITEVNKKIIHLLDKATDIKFDSQNIDSYINNVITHFEEKIKKERKEREDEKSILLAECIKPLKQFEKVLPKNLNEIPSIINLLINRLYPQIIPIGIANYPKYKNYEDAFNQIVNGGKLRKEIAEIIKSRDDWWHLEKKDKEPTKEEIMNVLELVKYSGNIKKLTFTENPNFDAKCERAYLDAIKANNSLITIILYFTNVSKEVTLEMLKMLEIKPSIKVLVVEKAKIQEKDAQELAKKLKLEINHWESRYWNGNIL